MTTSPLIGVSHVLFLGAGASRPLGKMLMGQFIDHLQNNQVISNAILFEDIIAKQRDLEFLLEELQAIEDKDYLQLQIRSRDIFPASSSNSFVEFKLIADRAHTLRVQIEREVFLHYRSIDDEHNIVRLFQPLFNALAGRTEGPIVVFTTNYDPAIERYCALTGEYVCIDGFAHDEQEREYVWSSANFLSPLVPAGKKALYLFKLHGSTDWIRKGKKMIRGIPIFTGVDTKHTNMMIYPATRKVAYEEPFFTSYYYLQECLRHARTCDVIGYSFRDYDALTRIQAAVRKNPELAIYVTDPDAKNLAEKLKRHGISSHPKPTAFEAGVSI